ncbi:hypothetical protein CR970_00175 [Candidatus Saccharibacteria bacterium]|nr:MAG: hypothetical protein CR970_00175 [Candidatus Saccharibacteria bacterium]
MSTITAIRQQVRHKDRYSLYVDGEYAFSLSESALLESQVASGQQLSDTELTALKQLALQDKQYNLVLRYAALRPRSEWEMLTYMHRKDIPEPVAKKYTDKLKRIGLLDDQDFAERWVANRRLLKHTSQARLRQELRQKHIDSSIIDTVLAEDQESTDEIDVIAAIIHKKRARYSDPQKLIAYLARQGFRYDAIKTALDRADDANP